MRLVSNILQMKGISTFLLNFENYVKDYCKHKNFMINIVSNNPLFFVIYKPFV